MGGTSFEFENVKELEKSIPFLSIFFKKNYNKNIAKKKGVPEEYIGELIEGWNKGCYIFHVNAESYFSPFWLEKKNEQLKVPIIMIKDGYANNIEIMDYLTNKGIKFTEESFKQFMHWKGTIEGFRCLRCRHSWKPRKFGIPKVCPKCKSPYWNRKKIRE